MLLPDHVGQALITVEDTGQVFDMLVAGHERGADSAAVLGVWEKAVDLLVEVGIDHHGTEVAGTVEDDVVAVGPDAVGLALAKGLVGKAVQVALEEAAAVAALGGEQREVQDTVAVDVDGVTRQLRAVELHAPVAVADANAAVHLVQVKDLDAQDVTHAVEGGEALGNEHLTALVIEGCLGAYDVLGCLAEQAHGVALGLLHHELGRTDDLQALLLEGGLCVFGINVVLAYPAQDSLQEGRDLLALQLRGTAGTEDDIDDEHIGKRLHLLGAVGLQDEAREGSRTHPCIFHVSPYLAVSLICLFQCHRL